MCGPEPRPTCYDEDCLGLPEVAEGYEWVSFDLDGTLAEHIWPREGIGDPIFEGIQALKHYREQGYRIIIYTARPWWDHSRIQAWLENHGVPFEQIVCGKLAVGLHIDDRAWRAPWATT